MSKSFRKRAFRAYQKVKTLKPARSLFDESHDVLATMDMGICYPGCIMEMSPGDTFHIWMESVIRMQPLNAPILHDIKFQSHWFFVPYRILWEEWVKFITGGAEGEYGGNNFGANLPSDATPALPRWRPSEGKNGVGSLWDYCGFPTGVTPEGALPLDFVRRCYNRIWNEYYRDETLQDEVEEDNEDLLRRNWKKDYFTSALTRLQRGVAPAMPLSGQALQYQKYIQFSHTSIDSNYIYFVSPQPFSEDTLSQFNSSSGTLTTTYNGSPAPVLATFGGNITNVGSSIGTLGQPIYIDSTHFKVSYTLSSSYSPITNTNIQKLVTLTDLSANSSSDIKDLRVAFQIQRWLELANRGGVRYTEFLRSFFGVSPRDDRLQRPEYIGGTSSPIVISEVLQTSSTDSEPTPQGNMAGHGIGASRTFVGSYTAV